MPLFLSTASGGGAGGAGPPPPPSSVPEAVQLHAGVLVDFASRRAVDLGGSGPPGPPTADGGGDAAASSGDGGDAAGSRRHAALSYQAVRTRGDRGGADGGDRDGGGPDLGVWDCRVRPPSSSASAALLRRVVVDRRGPAGPAGGGDDGEGEAADEGEGAAEKTEAGGIGARSVPILATVDLSDPSLVQPALEAMRSAVVEVYAGTARSAAPRRDRPNCTTSLKSLESTTFGSAKVVEEVGPGSGGGRRIALIVAALVPPPSDGAQSAQDEYVERQSRSLVLYHLSKFALETDCTLCFVSAHGGGEDNLEDAEGGGTAEGRDTAMSVDDLGRLVRRVALGLPPVEQGESAEAADGGGSDGPGPGRTPSVHPPGSHDGEVVRGALLRNASCEGRWDASSDDLAGALPPSAGPRPPSGGDGSDNGATEAAGGGGSGDDAWLSRLADTVGVGPEPTATPKRIASAPSSGNSVASSSRAGGRAAPGGGGSKVPAKKRGERVRAAKAKDGKPKDEKEVMNFFDSLLKK